MTTTATAESTAILYPHITENTDSKLRNDEERVKFLRVGDMVGKHGAYSTVMSVQEYNNMPVHANMKIETRDHRHTTTTRMRNGNDRMDIPIHELWDKVSWVLYPQDPEALKHSYEFVSDVTHTHVYLSVMDIFVAQLDEVSYKKAWSSELFSNILLLRTRFVIPTTYRSELGLTEHYDP